ncbi:MAG: ABC transporter ATP-binding protein, partial [Flavobacteriaceae bacterium]|nr:ABC transporter ATP-binding protein [Flavobacteriaceae bacterium]
KEIVKHYPKKIYDIRTDDMYKLILNLKEYEYNYAVHPFGEFVHYTDKRDNFNQNELIQFLESKKHANIIIQKTETTIEDAFMELAK